MPFINQTAIDWAAQLAVTRITECADPAALGDPRMQRAVELAKKQVANQLEMLAEMLGLIEAAWRCNGGPGSRQGTGPIAIRI